MPVRSSVCTYSPASMSASSKHSTVSSLSIGHYKPLASNSTSSYSSTNSSSSNQFQKAPSASRFTCASSRTGLTGASRPASSMLYNSSTGSSSYSPSSSQYKSPSSTTTSLYRPLAGSSSNFSSSSGRQTGSPSSTSVSSVASSRYSNSSISGASSMSSSTNDYYPYSTTTNHYYSPSLRRLSYTSQQSLASEAHSSSGQMMVYSSPSRPSSVLYSPSPPNAALASASSSRCSLSAGLAEPTLPSEVPRGLTNLGNTCYMNSVLQALYSIKPFEKLIESSYTSKPLTSNLRDLFMTMKRQHATRTTTTTTSSPSSSSSSSNYLLTRFHHHRTSDSSELGEQQRSPASAASFKETFSAYQSKFAGLQQQDAQEFLRYLINGCHDEMNQARTGSRSNQARTPPKTAGEAWAQYRDIVDNSPLVDMFVGQLCSTITCSQCQHQSHCWDPFWDLSLALNNHQSSYRSSCHLRDLIAHFTDSETLDGDERPACERCSKPTRSSKQINFTRLPRVLQLHLKKFSNDGYKLSSADVKCDESLELSSHRYYLAAAISHHGHSSSSGHYTAHCKYASRWFHFNDDRVKDVTNSFDCAKLDDAYVLFYTQDTSYCGNKTLAR